MINFKNPTKRILVLATSKPWISAISKSFPKSQLSWILSLDSLEPEMESNQFCAAIVEIRPERIDSDAVKIAQINNNAFNLKIFAVGGPELVHWQRLLRTAGLSGWIWSHLQLSGLVQRVQTQQENAQSGSLTLESTIETQLPWANASEDKLA